MSEQRVKHPVYPRLLHLQHVHPNAWQRALLGEGMALVGLLLSPLGFDLAPWWAAVALPVAMGGVVKAHDLLAGVLAQDAPRPAGEATPPP